MVKTRQVLKTFWLVFLAFFHKFALMVFYGLLTKWLEYLESNLKSHLKKEVFLKNLILNKGSHFFSVQKCLVLVSYFRLIENRGAGKKYF